MLMSLIALGGMLIFTTAIGIYLAFFSEFSMTFRVLAGINAFFGALFLSSQFISTYQSYQMVKLADSGNAMSQMVNAFADVQKLFSDNSTNPDEIKEEKNVRGIEDK
jgi:hypothetical protein